MMTFILQGKSLLWTARYNGHLEIVKTLIEAGANVNQTDKVHVGVMYNVHVCAISFILPPSYPPPTLLPPSLVIYHP